MVEQKLPPLNALKAFEAAARHLSVKIAAGELCVTPGAVSQLIRTLEAHLGVKLFERVNRGIFLTEAGRNYLPPIRKGWSLWFQAEGIDDIGDIGPPRGSSFDDSSLLLKAVIAGQGAGLLPAAMLASDINEGRLVKLANATRIEAFAYYLVYPESNHGRPKIVAFQNWILNAAGSR